MNKMFTKPLKCCVFQSEPYFQLHDGQFNIQAYWTPQAYQEFTKEFPQYPVSKLKDFMV